MDQELQQALDGMEKKLLSATTEAAKSEIKKEINSTITTEVEKTLGTKAADAFTKLLSENAEVKGLREFKIKAEKDMAENQKWIDEQIAKGQTINLEAKDIPEFQKALAKGLDENKDKLSGYTKNGRTAITMEMKAVGNIGSSNFTVSGTQGFVNPTMFFEPGRKPYENRHMRDIFRVVPQGPSTDVYVIRDSGGEGGPTMVLPGAAKPQSDRDWVKTIVPITKIAHYYKVPEEYLDDITWLRDEIAAVGVEELLTKEDELILTATAATGQFAGLNQSFNSTAFSAPTGWANSIQKTTNYDVLVAAWTQLRMLKRSGNVIFINPADYGKLLVTKDTTGLPLLGIPNATLPNLYGMPIIPHTAIEQDKYFVLDANDGKIGQRAGLSVRFYDQNEDDAIKNMVTIVIEERITFAMRRNDSAIYGDFGDNASAISASY